MNQEEIKKILSDANEKYRNGEDSGLSDEEYDNLLSQVNDQEFKNKVGIDVSTDKVVLPVPMGSMEKIKTNAEIYKWKEITDGDEIIITPKYDGLALLVEYGMNGKFVRAMTRGNGTIGQDVTKHMQHHKLATIRSPFNRPTYVIGELIMSTDTFNNKYSDKYKNARNMVAGALARKDSDIPIVRDMSFMAFNIVNEYTPEMSKAQILDKCNLYFNMGINGRIVPSKHFTDIDDEVIEEIYNLRMSYSDYEIDGYILECNSHTIRKSIGNETNSLNPKFARAYKPAVEETADSLVEDITWSTSKSGKLAPVVRITPVELDGVTISNVTAYNAKFVIDNNLSIGSAVTIIRSGSVIPKIIAVSGNKKVDLPTECTSCYSKLVFSDTKVDLVCINEKCPAKTEKSIISFFSTLEIENCKAGTISTLIEHGFDSVEKITNMELSDFDNIPGFGKTRANNIITSIKDKLQNGVLLEDLQHASNLFYNLGSRKLKLLNHYNSKDMTPKAEDIVDKIEGFSEISAQSYLNGWSEFWAFVEGIPVVILSEDDMKDDDLGKDLEGEVYVFSGFRDKELKSLVESRGATVGSGVTKKTTKLILTDITSTSSKVEKAKTMGIPVISKDEFVKFING